MRSDMQLAWLSSPFSQVQKKIAKFPSTSSWPKVVSDVVVVITFEGAIMKAVSSQLIHVGCKPRLHCVSTNDAAWSRLRLRQIGKRVTERLATSGPADHHCNPIFGYCLFLLVLAGLDCVCCFGKQQTGR